MEITREMEWHMRDLRRFLGVPLYTLFEHFDTEYIARLHEIMCEETPEDVARLKTRMFISAMINGSIDICERLGLEPSHSLHGDIMDRQLYKRNGNRYSHHFAFTKWLHEEKGYPMNYRTELPNLQTPVDGEMLRYMRERYDVGGDVKPLRVGHSTTSLRRKVSPKLVKMVREHNIPIHKDDEELYEDLSRKLKGGDWEARRNLILFRRTMWK